MGTDNRAENERFPHELGWNKKTQVMTNADMANAANIIRNATKLLTGGDTIVARSIGKLDLHSGMF